MYHPKQVFHLRIGQTQCEVNGGVFGDGLIEQQAYAVPIEINGYRFEVM